jgi:DNA-binding XRE family transcriptional regulator
VLPSADFWELYKMHNLNKPKENEFLNVSNHSLEGSFFCSKPVVSGCYEPIYQIFRTLLLERNLRQQDLADGVSIDKANISRIVHGLYIPDLNLRLKIARFLQVDSCLIWRNRDLEHIRKLLHKQKKQEKKKDETAI